jgi:hypothetical protein
MISFNTAEIQQQTAKIKDKFDKYPTFAMGKGLDASSNYLNNNFVKQSLYPPSQSGSPFVWSSERQRRAFFATNGFGRGIPTVRTMELANSGSFKVNKSGSSLYIYYENTASYAKWVIGQFTQIIGHITRGWKPINTMVIDKYRNEVVSRFKDAAIKAWDEMSGQAPGL